ncbi:MAG: hypothetical protein RR283_07655 [Comamonas sp.]
MGLSAGFAPILLAALMAMLVSLILKDQAQPKRLYFQYQIGN